MARRRVRKKKLPEEPVKVTIESLAHDGRGVAHVDGKTVFIDEALPGEILKFVYTDIRRDFAEGKVVSLLTRAADRVEAKCPHYGVCGGCSFQHLASEAQIQSKQTLLEEQFRRIGKIDIPELWQPLTGSHWGYRHKARMGVKYVAKKGRVLVGFRERRNPFLAEITDCIVMHPVIGMRLMDLSEMIGGLSIRSRIPQIEVAIGDQECVLAFRVLDPPTAADKDRMKRFAQENDLIFYLQSKGPDSIVPLWPEEPVMPSYALPDHSIVFKFRPAMFTQVNTEINRKMVNRVLDALELTSDDTVLDLFCGLGNFTLPMARYVRKVVGVEGDLPLVKHARENAELNSIHNVEYHVADLSRDISGMPWARQHYDKILLDPSRAGAAEVMAQIPKWQPERIVYVSCNPATLARDVGVLVDDMGYTLVKAGVMDMFPQTAHVESIALLVK